MSAHVIDFAEPPVGRQLCDFCGEWAVELRLIDHDGWTADSLTCRECFGTHDGPDFSDLPLTQKAVAHV
jgi:hypothetical protein